MKNSEIEKPKFPFLVDVRDYLSNSMILKKNHSNPNDSEDEVSFDKTFQGLEKNKNFDLFAHILEG